MKHDPRPIKFIRATGIAEHGEAVMFEITTPIKLGDTEPETLPFICPTEGIENSVSFLIQGAQAAAQKWSRDKKEDYMKQRQLDVEPVRAISFGLAPGPQPDETLLMLNFQAFHLAIRIESKQVESLADLILANRAAATPPDQLQ